MIFDFDLQKVFTQSVQVDDIGNCALRCQNLNNNTEYYIITKTIMGKTSLFKYGPRIPDLDELCNGFELVYKKIDYKEQSIAKEINKYINDTFKAINSIDVIEETEALEAFPSISNYIASCS